MLVYWTLFIAFGIGALAWTEAAGRASVPFIVAIIALTLMIGLRWQVGPDWAAYFGIYKDSAHMTLSRALLQMDPGFYGLIWLLHQVAAPFWMLNLVCAAIFAFGLARFTSTLPNPWLAMCVAIPYLVIVVGMNLMRQAAALGFVLLALRHVGVKPIWRSLMWVLVGSLFHASAIIAGLLICISYTRNRFYAFLLLLVSAIAEYYILSTTIDSYFQRYGTQLIDSGGVYVRLALNIVPAIALFVLRGRFFFPEDEGNFWRNVAILSVLILPLPLFVHSTTSIDRISLYAAPLQLLFFSAYPMLSTEPSKRLVSTVAIVLYSAATMVIYFSFGTHARYFVPYRVAAIWPQANAGSVAP